MKKHLLNLLFGLLAITALGQTPDNWTVIGSAVTIEQETTNINEGTSSAKITWTSTSNQDIHSDEFDVIGDASYSYSLDVFENTNAGRVRMVIAFDGALTYSTTYSIDNANWQTLNITGTVPTGATKGYVKLRFYDESAGWEGNGNQATVYIDNAIYSDDATPNKILNGGFETWPAFANIASTVYISETELDVIYDGSVTTVDPVDYNLTGTAAITFSGATIDGTDDKIVHLTGASASITGDATLDNIADANSNLNFYAGIIPFANINTTNAGGIINDGVAATFIGIVSANDEYNGVWIADATGAYNGAYIYDSGFDAQVTVGDEIKFSAVRGTYNNATQLSSPSLIETISTGNIPYGPSIITGADINTTIAADTDPAESWEGQLVKIANATITSDLDGTDYFYTATDDAGTTTFRIGDNVNYKLAAFTLTNGTNYSITGVADYEDGAYRINPRSMSDIQSPVATVTSTVYTVDNGAETIVNIPSTTTLTEFESNLTPSIGTSFETYQTDGITVATDLATGYKVIVTAEDEITTKTYTVTINISLSTDATVSSEIYTVDNGSETITNIPYTTALTTFESNITPAAGASFETYESDGSTVATDLATGYKVIGTAEDATTIKTYTITLNAINTDATLNEITFNETPIASFDAAIYTYNVELPYGTTEEPLVDATENDPNAEAVVTQATDVEGDEAARTATIVVTAEDNSTKLTYTVVFSIASETGNLIISEYIEGGTGSNKTLEIFNPNASEVDLSQYTIKQSYNGAGWGIRETADSRYVLPLTGTLAAGEVYTIINDGADIQAIIDAADLALTYDGTANNSDGSNIAAFNGNDAIGLFKNGTLIDVIGIELTADGAGPWAVGDTTEATKNYTLVRKYGITTGNTDWTASAGTNNTNSEWVVYSDGYVDNIGLPSVNQAPSISNITFNPTAPTAIDAVTVSVTIIDDVTATDALTVGLFYGIEAGSETNEVTLNQVGATDVFEGTIPASAETVFYKVTANDGSLTAEETGNYSITVGINDIVLNTVKLYPNPSNGLVTLELNNANNEQLFVEVYDVIGKMVYKTQITENVTNIDLTQMNAGIYYVSVNNNNSKKVSKIMIQ